MEDLVEKAGLAKAIELDSAGTGAHHVGERADRRSRSTAEARGVRLTSISRQFLASDFDIFDYVLAMDQDNLENLQAVARGEDATRRLFLFRSFDPESETGASVPDPYYGGPGGFDEVFDICEDACRGLLEHIRNAHSL